MAQQIAPFKKGDRVVFTGNSITDGGHYHSYIWLYYMTRFPKERMDMFNAGIGGDVAGQIYARLDSDVFAHHPNIMTLTFGMNDTGYQNFKDAKQDSSYDARIKISAASFVKIQAKLKTHPEVKKILFSSPPYDNTAKTKSLNLNGKNASLQKVAQIQEAAAKANGWAYLDLNTAMTAINQREQQRDSLFTMEGSDRIHPTNDGQMVIAYLFLKAQGMAGKKVADIVFDSHFAKTIKQENCIISNPVVSANKIEFTYLAKSLPYPLDTIPSGFGRPGKTQAQGMQLVPFMQEMNQELLTVKGLKDDKRYRLIIDHTVIGDWQGSELASGLNLATLVKTPQYQQALAVMHLNEERWAVERHLREYYWMHYSILQPHGLLYNDSLRVVDTIQRLAKKDFFVAATFPTYQKARLKPVRDAWEKEMQLLIDQIYIVNQPVPHRFRIEQLN